MTDSNVDEHLLTAAKLREQVAGDLDGDDRLLPHTGLISDPDDRATFSFLHGLDGFTDSDLDRLLSSTYLTDEATEAVNRGDGSKMSYIVGVTEQDLDGSALRLPMLLLDQLDNNGAPAFVLGAGNPNTGKTNLMAMLAELRSYDLDEYLILSNSRTWELSDIHVTSAHELAIELIENRDVPKFVFVDEGSTHFDARTNRREVAAQFTPLAKRMAKIGVDAFGTVGHTGKDVHPEYKRLSTLSFFKIEKKVVEFYENWPADADFPTDQLFDGTVEGLEPTAYEPDPDDAAPWSWNLKPDLFSLDLDWPALLDELRDRGPAEE